MSCACPNLPATFYLDEAGREFPGQLELIETADGASLHKCRNCDAYWAIDAWDKFHHQVVESVRSPDNWSAAPESARMQLLLNSRGGEIEGRCRWAGCAGTRVKGTELCIEHLYRTGARR